MGKLTERGQYRYQQVMLEAARLFNAKGYALSSMDEIAAACKCDVANLYHYFPTKEHILYDGIKRALGTALIIIEKISKKKKLSPSQKLKRIILEELEARATFGYQDLFSKYRFYLEPVHVKELISIRDAYDLQVRKVILEGIACGELRPVDERLVSVWISSFIERFLLWYTPGGRLSPQQIAEAIFDLFINGTCAPTSQQIE
jgi:AcrR family transcriptional regulator